MNPNEIMSSLAEYMRIADETAAIIDGLKDQLKAAMQAAGTDKIIGAEKPYKGRKYNTAFVWVCVG